MPPRAAPALPAPAAAGSATSGAPATSRAAPRGPSAAAHEHKHNKKPFADQDIWCKSQQLDHKCDDRLVHTAGHCTTEAGGHTRPKEIALTTEDRMRSSTVGTSRGRRTPDDAETVTARERVSRRLATRLRLKGPSRCSVCTHDPCFKSTVKILWRRTGGHTRKSNRLQNQHRCMLHRQPRSRPRAAACGQTERSV